jgi:glutamate dehydrogenase
LITAYTKIDLIARLETTTLVEDTYLVGRVLRPYFPRSLAERFSAEVGAHRLHHELIATRAVNELVDLSGSTFVFNFVRDRGVAAEDVVRAWVIATDVLSIHERAADLKRNASNIAADLELGAFLALERACRIATRWALAELEPATPIGAAVTRFKPAFETLCGEFESMLAASERGRFERAYRDLRADVADPDLAHGLARLSFVDHLLSVLSLSFSREAEPAQTADAYFRLGEHLNFAILDQALESIGVGEDRWERRAAIELAAELRAARLALCCAVLDSETESNCDVASSIEQLKHSRESRFADLARLFDELKAVQPPTLPAIQVTIRALTRLASP